MRLVRTFCILASIGDVSQWNVSDIWELSNLIANIEDDSIDEDDFNMGDDDELGNLSF